MITVIGLPQLQAKFLAIMGAVKLASKPATATGGQVVANAMRLRAPRRTGRLAASITVRPGQNDEVLVGSTVPYDRFVQLGTRYMEPQAYGEEAADSASTAVAGAMAAIYKAALP